MKCFRLLLILSLLNVVKCQTVSKNELQDFKEFLEKTSALDHTLKDGFPHDEDEEEPVSDHAWEESGKFEGDLILSDRQRHLIVEDVAEGLSRNGLNDITKRWPNNEVIYYIQKEHFTGTQVQAIQDGIDDIAQSSCITFRPYKKGDRDAVVIQGSRRGCYSQVGYQGGYQVLNLSGRHPVGRGCFRHGTVVHEMLHTLGFYHMQSSADRDDFINVAWENIIQGAKHNFRKYNSFAVTDFGVGYDYDSVLHYSKRAFSSNGKPTLIPKQDGVDIGQRIGMSDKDKDKLNKMYCDSSSNNFDQSDSISSNHKKKQTNKNKPFQGHGIGYHQGKAMVIKLPTADTAVLHEFSYPTYDYYPPRYELDNFYKDVKTLNEQEKNVELQQKIDNLDKQTTKEENSNINNTNDENPKKEKISVSIKNDTESIVDKSKLDEDLNDAFDRLRKIIKTHVYPKYNADIVNESKNNTSLFKDAPSTNYNKEANRDNGDEINNNNQESKDFQGFGENLQKRLSSILKETDDEHEKLSSYSRDNLEIKEKPYGGYNSEDNIFPKYKNDDTSDYIYDALSNNPYKYPKKWFRQ